MQWLTNAHCILSYTIHTVPSPSGIPTSPNALLGLELIEEELQSICRNGIVERDDVIKLCSRLGVDGKDEQVRRE